MTQALIAFALGLHRRVVMCVQTDCDSPHDVICGGAGFSIKSVEHVASAVALKETRTIVHDKKVYSIS